MNAEEAPEIEVIVISDSDDDEVPVAPAAPAEPEIEVITLSSDDSDEDDTLMESSSDEDDGEPPKKALLAEPGDDPPPEGYYKLVAQEGTVYLAPAAFVESWKEFQLAKEFCEPFGPEDPIPVTGLTSETLNFVLTFYAMYEDQEPYEPPTEVNMEGRIVDKDKPSMSYLNKATLRMFDQLDDTTMELVMNASCFFEYQRLQDYLCHYLSKVMDPMEDDEFNEFVITTDRPTDEERDDWNLDEWEREKNKKDAYDQLSDREKRAIQRQKRKLEKDGDADEQPTSSKKARTE